jgi:hypothetical protein
MSADRGRRIAVVVLVLLLLAPLPVLLLPSAPGTVRLAGIALVWWYAAAVGPLVGGALATAILTTSDA